MISHLDRFVTQRMATRIVTTVLVFFGLILLSESLDTWRFDRLSRTSGELTAWLAILTAATRWAIKTLSVTVLLGSILALLEFQSHREFVVMKAAGISVWRIMRGPLVFVILFGLLVTVGLESASTQLNREINPTPPGLGGGVSRSTDDIWLAQTGEDGIYFMRAGNQRDRGRTLRDVVVFPTWDGDVRTITANRAHYQRQTWELRNAVLTHRDGSVSEFDTFELTTDSTPNDLRLTVGSTEDFTYYELIEVLSEGIADPIIRSSAATRFFKLTALPLMLVGSLLIAFAFTAGYRRNNAYGTTIIYGIILGFVVFVITEMADRAGSSSVLDPAYATWGPAAVAVLIGISVLLRKEDGRA